MSTSVRRTLAAAALLAAAAAPDAHAAEPVRNRLGGEASAYLRSAARQPVAWMPWGDAAFARARRLDRPILLDVGAAWCTYCHVMDAESYDDPAIADRINRSFVAVKVDRDERPDIDRRYQAAVSAAFGVSGWPLTAILTPSGELIFGGTYFPPTDRDGRPGLTTVLGVVADSYREERDAVLGRAAAITTKLVQGQAAAAGVLTPQLRDRLRAAILDEHDFAHGGFPAPTSAQFPRPWALQFLLRRTVERSDAEARAALLHTLDAMALGGVRDHVGGGFHRYTVDRAWRVPHFEKLTATNADLLRLYLAAWQATGRGLYREVAEELLPFAVEHLADPAGGLYASLDADGPDGVEGSHYTWTWAEIDRLLAPAEAQAVRAHWGLEERPDRVLNQPERNVPAVVGSIEATATRLGRSVVDAQALVDRARAKLRAARVRRPPPAVDRARYTDVNAAMITAMLEASVVLDRPSLRQFAVKSLHRVLREVYRPRRGVTHVAPWSERWQPGFLDDHVQVTEAVLTAYQLTGNPRFLGVARDLIETIRRAFWDTTAGGFLDRPPVAGQGLLGRASRSFQDGTLAAGNAVAARVLIAMAALTGEPRYREWVGETLSAFAGSSASLGSLGGGYALALDFHLDPPAQVVVVGLLTDRRTSEMWQRAVAAFRPGKVVFRVDSSRPPDASLPESVRAKLAVSASTDGATAYVCAGAVCSLPVRDPVAVDAVVRTFGTNADREGSR